MKDASKNILIERNNGHLTITLNRSAAGNALSPEMVEELISVLTDTSNLRCCVIKASGKNFCAGFDLSDLRDLSDGDLLYRFLRIETLLQIIHHASFPVIALAQGHAMGAGADLFAACTFRIAASDAKFKMPGWNFELALGTRRLSHLVGADAARTMLTDTAGVSADKALEIGLATEITEVNEWSKTLDLLFKRSTTVSQFSNQQILGLTTIDTRDADMAAIVRTAGRPGLKKRIESFQKRVNAERAARRKEPVDA